MLDVEFTQTLQDMIPISPANRSPSRSSSSRKILRCLNEWAPKVGDSISKVQGVVDVLNGIDNTISGPAVMFQINPSIAARAGFTAEDVATTAAALVEGEPSRSRSSVTTAPTRYVSAFPPLVASP